jgi:hypothetical protein
MASLHDADAPFTSGAPFLSLLEPALFFQLHAGRDRSAGSLVPVWKSFPARALLPDPVQGGLWIGFYEGGMVYLKNGQIRTSTQPPMGWALASSTSFVCRIALKAAPNDENAPYQFLISLKQGGNDELQPIVKRLADLHRQSLKADLN